MHTHMLRPHAHAHAHASPMRMLPREQCQAGGQGSTSDLGNPRHPLQHQAVQPAQHLLPQQRLRLALIKAVVLQALQRREQMSLSMMKSAAPILVMCAFTQACKASCHEQAAMSNRGNVALPFACDLLLVQGCTAQCAQCSMHAATFSRLRVWRRSRSVGGAVLNG